MNIQTVRLVDEPIIWPSLHPSIGVNIQSPSLIRVPEWVKGRLGAYYLYFADHKGSYIRLAYANDLAGPWKVHPPGSLHLAETDFLTTAPLFPMTSFRRSRHPTSPRQMYTSMKRPAAS